MTTPNKITLFRIFIIPVMVIICLIPQLNIEISGFFKITISQLIFLILFIIGSISDFLDGYLARKNNQVTTFGKFLDPIADKILVLTALIFLFIFPYWGKNELDEIKIVNLAVIFTGVLIIILREFLVTGVRLLAVDSGIVIAASKLGKIKTASTMIAIIFMLFNGFGIGQALKLEYDYFSFTLYGIAILFTIISGVDYLYKNRNIILETM